MLYDGSNVGCLGVPVVLVTSKIRITLELELEDNVMRISEATRIMGTPKHPILDI